MEGNRISKWSGKWWESTDKPGSVVDSHSSGMCVTAHLVQPTREPCGPHAPRRSVTVPLFGLAPGGVCPAPGVTARAVGSYIKPDQRAPPFHPYLCANATAVSFLWHFPWDCSRWTLSTALPCGARTFLRLRAETATVWPTPACNLSLFSLSINLLSDRPWFRSKP